MATGFNKWEVGEINSVVMMQAQVGRQQREEYRKLKTDTLLYEYLAASLDVKGKGG